MSYQLELAPPPPKLPPPPPKLDDPNELEEPDPNELEELDPNELEELDPNELEELDPNELEELFDCQDGVEDDDEDDLSVECEELPEDPALAPNEEKLVLLSLKPPYNLIPTSWTAKAANMPPAICPVKPNPAATAKVENTPTKP